LGVLLARANVQSGFDLIMAVTTEGERGIENTIEFERTGGITPSKSPSMNSPDV
jgi:hypothetical protein